MHISREKNISCLFFCVLCFSHLRSTCMLRLRPFISQFCFFNIFNIYIYTYLLEPTIFIPFNTFTETLTKRFLWEPTFKFFRRREMLGWSSHLAKTPLVPAFPQRKAEKYESLYKTRDCSLHRTGLGL